MKIDYHSNFIKSFKERVSHKRHIVKEFKETLLLFQEDSSNPILEDHALKDDKAGWRSFSVTNDIRVVYKRTKEGILLYDIGTHTQVY